MTPSLALELGKSAPVVHCHDVTTVLAGDWVQRMKDTLVQCFRNALYHGIEPRDARCSAGKTPRGTFASKPTAVGDALEVHIADDGRGLPLAVLRQAAGGDLLTDDELAERIFQRGVSSAASVGLVAGRGVGLDLVRFLFRERGGDAVVRFTGEERDGHRPMVLVLVLPSSAVVPDVVPDNRGYRRNSSSAKSKHRYGVSPDVQNHEVRRPPAWPLRPAVFAVETGVLATRSA